MEKDLVAPSDCDLCILFYFLYEGVEDRAPMLYDVQAVEIATGQDKYLRAEHVKLPDRLEGQVAPADEIGEQE